MSTQSVDLALKGTSMGGANYAFKSKYTKTLEISTLIALGLHLIAVFSVPPMEITPYSLKEPEMVAIEIPDDIIIPPPPEEVERPQIPTEMEISDDVDADDTIPETDFNPFAPPEIPEETATTTSFYAFDSPPKPIKTAAPEYPELARAAGAEGVVHVEVTIDESGRVVAARVVRSDTIKSLEEAARKAALDWLFTPAKQRDTPVKAKIVIPFEFNLS
ncbi:MAG: energy transducer TonB [Candidatus Eisenbacteria bacterium]|uniref:Energy transducer TonB n=1 Tax=Eiseniibacteriota bacterium TaxID=2212470 RepID=A0A7Y2E910_UNCEI|nr:energy transducer TonB [Candidatus Eisenbacteria bacterium]